MKTDLMKLYAIKYTRIPTNFHDSRVSRIGISTRRGIAPAQIGRPFRRPKSRVCWIQEYVSPASKGRIITLDEFAE